MVAAPCVAVPENQARLFDETSYRPPKRMTYEEWCEAGEQLQLMAKASVWWLGDWLVFGDRRFGEDRAAAALDTSAVTGLEYTTVRSARWLAEKIPPERRRPGLSWSHHREIASLPEREQEQWLDRAECDGLSRDELRAQVRAYRERVAEQASAGAPGREQPAGERPTSTDIETAAASSNVVDFPRRPITEGYDDSRNFDEACSLRFGMERGGEVATFVREWCGRHAPDLLTKIE